jgi:hypothetical protein
MESSVVEDEECSGGVRKAPGVRSRTIRRWLNQLGFSWRDISKGVFVDGHERDDVLASRVVFLAKMQELQPYMVEFCADGSMASKQYPNDCQVGGPDRRPVIFITHDESIFSANDGRHQAWLGNGDHFLRPKGKGKGIMVSDFLLPWSRLNLLLLSLERQQELIASGVPSEACTYFEYGQEAGYWDGEALLQQITKKALPIAQALYPGYQLLFLFDNATSHSVYAANALRTAKMNKGPGGQQPFLRNGWYVKDGVRIEQEMHTVMSGGVKLQKCIQLVLQERQIWPAKGIRLECPKQRCPKCADQSGCRTCVKGTRCESCKRPKIHSSTACNAQRICDECVRRKERCQCVQKQRCGPCGEQVGRKCLDCEALPPSCATAGL